MGRRDRRFPRSFMNWTAHELEREVLERGTRSIGRGGGGGGRASLAVQPGDHRTRDERAGALVEREHSFPNTKPFDRN